MKGKLGLTLKGIPRITKWDNKELEKLVVPNKKGGKGILKQKNKQLFNKEALTPTIAEKYFIKGLHDEEDTEEEENEEEEEDENDEEEEDDEDEEQEDEEQDEEEEQAEEEEQQGEEGEKEEQVGEGEQEMQAGKGQEAEYFQEVDPMDQDQMHDDSEGIQDIEAGKETDIPSFSIDITEQSNEVEKTTTNQANEEQISILQQMLKEKEAEIKNLQQMVHDNQKQISDLEARVGSYQMNEVSLIGKTESIAVENNNMRTALEEEAARQAELIAEVQNFKKLYGLEKLNNEHLEDVLAKKDEYITRLQDDINPNKEQDEQQRMQQQEQDRMKIQFLSEKVAKLENENFEKDSEIGSMKGRLEEQTENIQQLKLKIQENKEMHSNETSELKKTVLQLQTELSNKEADIIELKRIAEEAKTSAGILKETAELRKKHLDAQDKLIEKLKAQVEKLAEENTELEVQKVTQECRQTTGQSSLIRRLHENPRKKNAIQDEAFEYNIGKGKKKQTEESKEEYIPAEDNKCINGKVIMEESKNEYKCGKHVMEDTYQRIWNHNQEGGKK